MIRLLLLSCGTNACYHISKILKEKFRDDFYIVGCDINKLWKIQTCLYLDDFFQAPLSNDENYYKFVLDICRKEKINWILPSFDSDQFLFSCDNEDLKELGVYSFGINSSLEFYKNKDKTNKYLESIGIPVPKKFLIEDIEENQKYFIKPLNGIGSSGAEIKQGSEISLLKNKEKYIVQEICHEPEITLECFCYKNKIYSIARERLASKSGVCTKARVFRSKKLLSIACKFAQKTNLPYIFNMQFMKNKSGSFVCTDLNLRTAGGMSLSYAAGWDEVSALAKIMLCKNDSEIISSVNKDIPEQYVVRHYEELVTKIVKNKIAFDLDGTLLDSRKRHEIVMKEVLKNHSVELDVSDLVSFKSYGNNNIEWLLSKNVSENEAKEINKEWISLIENEEYLKNDVLYPDVIKVLKNLSKENDLFLITARNNKANVVSQIRNLGIAQYFKNIYVVSSSFGTAALKSEKLRENFINIFIGDTESDYEAALIADCKFEAVSYGFRNKVYWEKRNINCIEKIESIK